jgi:sterol 3beta-glucosyltransferase
LQPTSFLIPTIGTRGDLQPYIALASQLMKAGHDPIVASHPCMAQLVKRYNVKFASIGPDIDIGREAAIIRAIAPHWMIGFMRVMKFSFKMLEESHEDIKSLARDSQVMVVSHTAAGSIEADQLKMKSISVSLFPQAIPVEDPSEPLFKRMVGSAAGWGMGLMMKKPLDRIRQRLGVEPMGEAGITSRRLNLIPISPYVIPPDPRWETRHQMTGYWFAETPENWSLPDDLLAFLKAGDPPVVINLGAMALGDDDDEDLIDLVLSGLENVGLRAVIQGWHTQLTQKKLPANTIHVGSVPHTWLLPQACGFIHHGGFGSTAAAFQAGIPALVIPHIIDQFIWGQKVHELRVGVAPIPRKKIGKENFTKALAQLVEDTRLQENAAALGEQIRSENGLETAVKLIEAVCEVED